MDVDVCGPSMPTMLGLAGETVHASASGWSPAYVHAYPNLCLMSIAFLLEQPDEAVIWRGPRKNGLIKNFLRDVDYHNGESVDYMLIDTPPGMSDEHLSLVTLLKQSGIDGALLITTPQEVCIQDVRREADFCRKVGLPVLGIIENMAGFVCPSCNGQSDIFHPSTGGAQKLAKDLGVELLGSIPLDPRIGQCADSGWSVVEEFPDSIAAQRYLAIVDRLSLS